MKKKKTIATSCLRKKRGKRGREMKIFLKKEEFLKLMELKNEMKHCLSIEEAILLKRNIEKLMALGASRAAQSANQ